MIKRLIEKFEIRKELSLIKKHFRIAKKHKSSEELEKVQYELLDFQGELIKNNKLTEETSFIIYNLLCEIDYARINLNQLDRRFVHGYDY